MKPLAERLRPSTLADYIGQKHLVGEGAVLRQMIESVLGQTFCRVELVLADGSFDDSVEKIVREYMASDDRIKYKRLEESRASCS